MRCLADFLIDSDLCLTINTESLILNDSNGQFSVTLSNAQGDHAVHDAVLSAQLVFEAPSFEGVRDIALDKLAQALNSLTYTTNRKFALKLLKRIIDWTPGLTERDAIIFNETPEWDLAEPVLDQTLIDTAERILAIQSEKKEQQAAMRWYRRGIEAENLEDQFSYFWFALEITAQSLKGSEKVASRCPKCKGPLFCKACGDHPMHRRYQGEAIKHLVERVHHQNSNEIFDALQLIRHTLMHGGRIASVLSQLPCNANQAVDKLAFVVWQAIGLMFDRPDPCPDQPLTFGYVDSVVRRTLVAGVHIKTGLVGGDPHNPQISDFPRVHFEVIKDNIYGADENLQ